MPTNQTTVFVLCGPDYEGFRIDRFLGAYTTLEHAKAAIHGTHWTEEIDHDDRWWTDQTDDHHIREQQLDPEETW